MRMLLKCTWLSFLDPSLTQSEGFRGDCRMQWLVHSCSSRPCTLDFRICKIQASVQSIELNVYPENNDKPLEKEDVAFSGELLTFKITLLNPWLELCGQLNMWLCIHPPERSAVWVQQLWCEFRMDEHNKGLSFSVVLENTHPFWWPGNACSAEVHSVSRMWTVNWRLNHLSFSLEVSALTSVVPGW